MQAFGLDHVEPELARADRDRRRLEAASAPLRPVGARDDERRPVRAVGQAVEDGSREVRGAEVDRLHALTAGEESGGAPAIASRMARIACLR